MQVVSGLRAPSRARGLIAAASQPNKTPPRIRPSLSQRQRGASSWSLAFRGLPTRFHLRACARSSVGEGKKKMSIQIQFQPGSPLPLTLFHAWCRVAIAWAMHEGRPPALLFADGPSCQEPQIAEWAIGQPLPESDGFLTALIEHWMTDTARSQIGISIPFQGDVDGSVAALRRRDRTRRRGCDLRCRRVPRAVATAPARRPAVRGLATHARQARRLSRVQQVALPRLRQRLRWRN